MAGKRPISGNSFDRPTKQRKTISIETKLEVLRRFEKGQRSVDIGKSMGLAPTTVKTIRDNESKIRKTAENVSARDAPYVSRHRSELMEKMERLLSFWVDDLRKRDSPVTLGVVQEKALCLFEDLKRQLGEKAEKETFVASRGWFERFKRRSLVAKARTEKEQTNADQEAAEEFIPIFKKIIEGEDYTPEQVFNVEMILLDEIRAEKRKDTPPEPARALTATFLADVFQNLDRLTDALIENDPDQERSYAVCKNLLSSVDCYREIYKKKKVFQKTLGDFF